MSWTAPVDNGGAPITSYQVENSSTGQVFSVSSGSVISLSVNSEHTFRVRAVNAAGPGDWSNTDTALSGYWTFNPGNGGGSTTFTVPSGVTSVSYQIYSNGGASSKPDTRTYSMLYGSYVSWWGPELIGYYETFGMPYWFSYHREAEGYSWWNYTPDWQYIYGYLQYAWGNITGGGGPEYYYMYTYNSGPSWSSYTHYGWRVVESSPQQVQTGGSPAQGPTSGTGSSISVPGWGSDSTGYGSNNNRDVRTGTFNATPGTNVSVNIGYSQGEYNYSVPGDATLAYAK